MAAPQPHSETLRNAGQLCAPSLSRHALWCSPLLLLLHAWYWRIPDEKVQEGRWSLLYLRFPRVEELFLGRHQLLSPFIPIQFSLTQTGEVLYLQGQQNLPETTKYSSKSVLSLYFAYKSDSFAH